mmetsp:Transcript_76770/g.124206  ORF Transcript_76770/g.124206 Transcript_76770/m.124206 type:complete len:83 (-) Transcript_76770:47-295(-)
MSCVASSNSSPFAEGEEVEAVPGDGFDIGLLGELRCSLSRTEAGVMAFCTVLSLDLEPRAPVPDPDRPPSSEGEPDCDGTCF